MVHFLPTTGQPGSPLGWGGYSQIHKSSRWTQRDQGGRVIGPGIQAMAVILERVPSKGASQENGERAPPQLCICRLFPIQIMEFQTKSRTGHLAAEQSAAWLPWCVPSRSPFMPALHPAPGPLFTAPRSNTRSLLLFHHERDNSENQTEATPSHPVAQCPLAAMLPPVSSPQGPGDLG